MSIFRRMLMSNLNVKKAENYIANFTLLFDSTKSQYISGSAANLFGTGKDKGVGFFINITNIESVTVTFKDSNGTIVQHKEVLENNTFLNCAISQEINDISGGLYEVEIIAKPIKDDVIYIGNLSNSLDIEGADKTPAQYVDCYCLYSINKITPNPDKDGIGLSIGLKSYTESA